MLDDILERTDVSLDRARALLKAARDPGFGSSQPEAAPAPAAAPVAGGYRALCGWLTILPLHLGLSTQPFRLAHANVIRGLGCAEQPAALLASAAGPVANDKCRIALWQDEMVRCAAEAKFWKIVAKQHLVLSWSARGMCQNHTWQWCRCSHEEHRHGPLQVREQAQKQARAASRQRTWTSAWARAHRTASIHLWTTAMSPSSLNCSPGKHPYRAAPQPTLQAPIGCTHCTSGWLICSSSHGSLRSQNLSCLR